MIYLDLFLIAFLCVFIIDYSGVIDSVDSWLQKRFKNPFVHLPKPFSCSLCSSWWTGLIWLIIEGSFTVPNIAYVAFLSAMTPVMLRLLYFVRGFLESALEGFENYFNIK